MWRLRNWKTGSQSPAGTRPNKQEAYMTTENGKTVLDAQEARQGKELGVMRYVLHISLALAVIAGIVLYAIVFHHQHPRHHQAQMGVVGRQTGDGARVQGLDRIVHS